MQIPRNTPILLAFVLWPAAADPQTRSITGQDSGAEQVTTTYRGAGLSRGPRAGHHNIGFRCAQ